MCTQDLDETPLSSASNNHQKTSSNDPDTTTLEPDRIFISGSANRYGVTSIKHVGWVTPKDLDKHVKSGSSPNNTKPVFIRSSNCSNRPTPLSDETKMNKKMNIKLFPCDPDEIISIECGYNATFYLTKTGLYASGFNTDGELGIGHSNDVKDHIEAVVLPKLPLTPSYYVKKVVSGDGHNVVLMSTGEIVVFGKNGDGQLGLKNTGVRKVPKLIPSSTFSGEKIKEIACGYYHTLVLTESGVVYGCGRNLRNQVGCLPNHCNASSGFKPVSVLKECTPINNGGEGLKIVKIVCGSHHSLFLTEDGVVYAAGDNQFNTIGKKYPIFSPLEPFYSNNQETEEDPHRSVPYKYVTNVWCGSLSTFVQTRDDKIYVCGTANNRALFLEYADGMDYITKGFVECNFLSGKSIKEIVGLYSMIAVSESRDVYVCGNNKCQQLTTNDQQASNIKPQHEPFLSSKLKQYPQLDYRISVGFRTCSVHLYSNEKRSRNQNEMLYHLHQALYDQGESDKNYYYDISFITKKPDVTCQLYIK